MLNNQVANTVIDHALSLGADFAELFIERNQVNAVNSLSSEVQSVQSGIDFGIGIRMIYGNKVLYGYTNKNDEAELKKIASALAAKDLRDPTTSSTSFNFIEPMELHPVGLPLSQGSEVASKVAYLLKADAAARKASNLISQTRGICMQRQQAIELFNSEGLHTSDTRHYIRTSLTAIASDGSEQATGSRTEGGLQGWEIHEHIDASATGDEAARQALVNSAARQACPSGRMPVVIGNGFRWGDLSTRLAGTCWRRPRLRRKRPCFTIKMGEMIANAAVSAVDDGTLAKEWGSINIDDEGMQTQQDPAHQGRPVDQLSGGSVGGTADGIRAHGLRTARVL